MTELLPTDPISAPLARLLRLFEGPLNDVRFPGVDREVLEELAATVRERAKAVEAQKAALEEARQALDAGQKDLLKTAELALAYAKVFAQADEELSEELEALELSPASRSEKKPREKKRAPRSDKKEAAPKAPKKADAGLELPLVRPEAPGEAPARPEEENSEDKPTEQIAKPAEVPGAIPNEEQDEKPAKELVEPQIEPLAEDLPEPQPEPLVDELPEPPVDEVIPEPVAKPNRKKGKPGRKPVEPITVLDAA